MHKFEIICDDALKWLKKQPDHSLGNIVTGLPDMEETKYGMIEYLEFFREACKLIFKKVKQDGYCLFMQTDRKIAGVWLDKAFIIQQMASQTNISLKWHKIILLRPIGSTHIQRPCYSHYLCFSYDLGPGAANPDLMICGVKS